VLTHVTHAMRKLGLTNRVELATAYAQQTRGRRTDAAPQNPQRMEPGVSSAVPTAVAVLGSTS